MPFKPKNDQNDVSEEALKERSYLWMTRAFGLICVITLIADLILVGALMSLTPVVRVQPFFVTTQDKDQQVISVNRPNNAILSSQMLQESFVRQYLTARLGIGSDRDELERRWGTDGTIRWMSGDAVFENFIRNFATGLIDVAKKEGLTRDVRILNVTKIPRNDGRNLWQAEVRLTDMSRSSPEPQSVDWKVNMVITFGALRNGLQWEQRLQNPLGFTVMEYSQQIKK